VEEQRDVVARIRTGIEFWLQFHPDTDLELEEAPPEPWNSEQILEEAKLLRETVEAILEENPGHAFDLGVTGITVAADKAPLSPATDSIDYSEILDLHATNVTEAATYLPGLFVDFQALRNVKGIMFRGFDTRQAGIYMDGIPINLPYDGYSDLDRFLTNDTGMIEVTKGYSSPLLGPNGLGGSINMVTRQPEKKFEGDALFSTGSGRRIESGIHVGSRLDKFLIRGGMDWLETDYYPLSGDVTLDDQQPHYLRVNSDQRDVRYNGRIGWLPREGDQYIFTYTKQKAENDIPTYSGSNANTDTRWWSSPYWNRDAYYLNTNTGLGESSSIKFRAYYDKYPHALNEYNAPAQTNLTAFTPYDDYTWGVSSEYTTNMVPRHALSASIFFKDDSHKEQRLTFSSGRLTRTTPWQLDRDRYVSIGIQDVLNIASGLRATVGISMDYLSIIEAQDLDSKYQIKPFTCASGTTTVECPMMDKWTYNPLASISYSVLKTGTFFFSFTQKNHFPTLADRYLHSGGRALANPLLEPEYARNYNLGFTYALADKRTLIKIEVFRSDVYDAIEYANIYPADSYLCKSLGLSYCTQNINAGEGLHKGAEITIRSSPLLRLDVVTNYTYLQRSLSGPVVAFPTGTPKHKTVTTAYWRMPGKVLMLGTFRYESGAFTIDKANRIFPASRFATIDWGMTIPIGEIASLQGGVKNLLDRDYYYQEGYPEAGRNFYTNLRFRF
jgi:iron complex outermembrane receptor protein